MAYSAKPENDLTDLGIEELMNNTVIGASKFEQKDEEECHILFVSASERRGLSQIFRTVKQ